MKKLTSLFLIIVAVFCITACQKDTDNMTPPENSVKMVATVDAVDDRITVTVTESEYTDGIHWVITGENTEYLDKNGKKADRKDIKVGDSLEIYYNGQVMMSYPPQIVALMIKIR